MSEARSTSEDFFRDPELSSSAQIALRRAEAMGVIEAKDLSGNPNRLALIRRLRDRMNHLRIGQFYFEPGWESGTERTSGLRNLSVLLKRMNEALEGSPIPDRELPRLVSLLGSQLLSEIIDVSPTSIQRYLKGDRKTPDDVAARLHFVALVVGNLAGAYNEIGIRRWFERKRHQLSARSPIEVLGKNWAPEDDGPARVRQLAESLTTSPAT